MIMAYNGKTPKIGKNVFIAPTAMIIGDVVIQDNSSVWYGAVLRGDTDSIKVGCDTNIQDNCTVHADPGKPARIGDRVTVGHNAVVHGCTVEDDSLIGINAVVLNKALIKSGSIVGAGALVKEGQVIGPCQLATGIPAAIKKDLATGIIETHKKRALKYADTARQHRQIHAIQEPSHDSDS
ncbi:MAG: gamma carbonic anhydrase family protein [Desulfobacteraceae bacterium 4572_123]|nr:MAG: gamma carbonic anhydrase family protein [Desulfobacteraceae bacterium 4572_123]